MAYSSKAALLQAQINRYAAPMGFKVVPIDGEITAATIEGLDQALSYQADFTAGRLSEDLRSQADALVRRFRSAADVMPSIDMLVNLLTRSADALGLPAVAAPIKPPTPGQASTALLPDTSLPGFPQKRPGTAASLSEAFKNVPPWAVYVGAALAGYLLYNEFIADKSKRPA